MANPIPVPYKSYQQILDAVRVESMRLFLLACTEWKATRQQQTGPAPTRLKPAFDVVRTIAILTKIIRRSGAVARHIATLPALEEEREGRVDQRLELVFSVFAQHKVDLDTYYGWVDADLQRELDAEMEADYRDDALDDDRNDEPDPDTDVAGRRPMVLVGELCCDFGIATHTLPLEWLEPAPPQLRLLCARAAASFIRPSRPARKTARVKAHSHPRS